jgi:hypothetical protein
MTRTELRKHKANRMRKLENLFDIVWTGLIMGSGVLCLMSLFWGIWLVAYAMSGTTI